MASTNHRRSGSRSASPRAGHRHRHHHHHSHSSHRSRNNRHASDRKTDTAATTTTTIVPPVKVPVLLPFNARPVSKHDYSKLRHVFAYYLDIQKGLMLDELDRPESRGRFKRFVTHFNRGELARGWYERVMNASSFTAPTVELVSRQHDRQPLAKKPRTEEPPRHLVEDENGKDEGYREEEEGSSDEDMVGPTLPGLEPKRRAGVAIPSKDDLELQREQMAEDEEFRRLDLRFERKLDRRTQKERLDELVPRAEPGTRERQLEKKRELNDKMRSFREKSPDAEVDEGTLMGDGGGLEMFKKQKAAMERKKNERELRREQILRARIAEREERLQAHREKEENTMRLLHQLASRFQD